MAGFTDILGSLVQNGLSNSSRSRITNAFGGRSGPFGDLMGSFGQMMGGQEPTAGNENVDFSSMFGSVLGDSDESDGTPQSGGLQAGDSGGFGGLLGEVVNNFGSNKAALSGFGALGGALLGGGGKAVRGAVGGGALAVLASLAISALKKSGQRPSQSPATFYNASIPAQQQEQECEAEILVKAMISAAKADGVIDQDELQRIISKLDEDSLTEEEKNLFIKEIQAPLNINKVVASAGGRPELAAEIYAASLLAIEVDTLEEQQYMEQLAQKLELAPEAVKYIEETLAK